jgi:predicted DNA-binding protein (MmcQ/YjbR family)
MDTRRLKALCAGFPGATTLLHQAPVNVLSYKVGGRTFAYFKTSEPERWRFSIKVTPERFIELTDVPGIKPARFMGRWRWVTVVDVRSVPGDYLRELVDWSYRDAVARLSRKQQRLLARE